VEAAGAFLVHHAVAGPEGANVNFVSSEGPRGFSLRTYERGVNGETLACGTGVMATAQCLFAAGRGSFPMDARTAGGFTFRVDATSEAGALTAWSLAGDARVVARGRLAAGALAAFADPST
jgi:diaminopimelate epimerase